ncbi:tumor necrosis factor receptor superfamily member 9a isoform X1 [Anguilla rostrata]|uniref:tumor necrosis factor receptor superfamily member 9a isoform X1 n=1 Tax=Anguilla rostrata TaxID=7938 RepID=UPI0030D5E135
METAIRAVLPAVLLLIGCLEGCRGDGKTGCAIWLPYGETDVCCEKCRPGNRMVSKCGPDPSELCVPCGAGTYITEHALYACHSCTQCKGAQMMRQACTSSRDTVCGCVDGFRCADTECSRCAKECGRGEEPTDKLTCQACPEGTFNDQLHQKCIPWRTSCPLPGQGIVALGTAVHDIVCGNISDPVPDVKPKPEVDDGDAGRVSLMVLIACLSLTAITAAAGAVACGILRKRKEKTTKNTPAVADKPTTEGPQWEEQQVECSLCHPQQEECGSQDSVASHGSEDKLLPV